MFYRTEWVEGTEGKEARGVLNSDRSFTVIEGSDFADHMVTSLRDSRKLLREDLINIGVVAEVEYGQYKFSTDYTFTSLSAAISTTRGFQASGPKYWVYTEAS